MEIIIPPKHNTKYPFHNMKVGDKFQRFYDPEDEVRSRNRIAVAARAHVVLNNNNRKFRTTIDREKRLIFCERVK